jgi:hypothetical protein
MRNHQQLLSSPNYRRESKMTFKNGWRFIRRDSHRIVPMQSRRVLWEERGVCHNRWRKLASKIKMKRKWAAPQQTTSLMDREWSRRRQELMGSMHVKRTINQQKLDLIALWMQISLKVSKKWSIGWRSWRKRSNIWTIVTIHIWNSILGVFCTIHRTRLTMLSSLGSKSTRNTRYQNKES